MRLHIVPHLGELALRNITAADVRAYIAKLEASVSSVDYRRGIRSELSSILEAAVDDKRLARNPMDAKSVRWPKAPRRVPRAAAHLCLDHSGGRRVCRDLGAVARALLARDHSWLLCSLHAGGGKQGAHRHRRTAREAGRTACHAKLPRFSPGPLTGDVRCCTRPKSIVDCKAEEMGGLGKCLQK
ncbi:hypothetical protein [Streptomyces platensis]|uniref:hypothetical protein n=1 Tax=Streptomyces platensis TaxID=58346 RepID=UPI0036B2DEC0